MQQQKKIQHLIADNKQAIGYLGLYHKTEAKPGDRYLAGIDLQIVAEAMVEYAVTRKRSRTET